MSRFLLAALLLTSALLVYPAELGSQEPETDAPETKNRWQSFKDKGLSLLKPVQEKTESQIQDLLEELNEKYFPAIREAGFGVGEIRVTIGVPTAVTLHLQRFEKISQAKQEALSNRYREDAAILGILETLFATDRLEVEGYEANEVHISMGLPPSTTIVLSPSLPEG